MIRSAIMNVMSAAAIKAGKGLKRDFAELASLNISRKGPGDFVSEADKRAERTLYGELSKARPDYAFLMEESGAIDGPDKSHRFIIDPLNGTTNFLHGIAHFAISIGLEREGEIVAGIVYNPITEEMFMAEKGQGAFVIGATGRDNYRLRVSPRTELADSVIGCGIPHAGRSDPAQFMRELAGIMPRCSGVRRMGAAALDMAFVAAGRFEGFWERNLSAWDYAAGIILVKEAGGYVSALDGSNAIETSRSILAANAALHPELVTVFAGARK